MPLPTGRKQITVPKSPAARSELDRDAAHPSDLIEMTLTEREFCLLWTHGIFNQINAIADSTIDDFEDESIASQISLSKVVTWLDERLVHAERELGNALRLLRFLFDEARLRNTEVHFYF